MNYLSLSHCHTLPITMHIANSRVLIIFFKRPAFCFLSEDTIVTLRYLRTLFANSESLWQSLQNCWQDILLSLQFHLPPLSPYGRKTSVGLRGSSRSSERSLAFQPKKSSLFFCPAHSVGLEILWAILHQAPYPFT